MPSGSIYDERVEPGRTASFTGERWAIIVGISHYKDSALNLEYANHDALEFHRLLRSPVGGEFKEENILLLIDEQATTQKVTSALRTFLKKPDRNDLVVIYFACHGMPDPERPANVYLLTHDVDRTDIAGTAVPMDIIDRALRDLNAERVILLADTCHSAAIGRGVGTRSAMGDAAAVNAYLRELGKARPGIALLTSAEVNEVSFEGPEWGDGHGVFTFALLEGMRGAADVSPRDGIVTTGELFEYVRERVKIETDHRQHPAIGTTGFDRDLPMSAPGLSGSTSGRGEPATEVSAPVSRLPLGRRRRIPGAGRARPWLKHPVVRAVALGLVLALSTIAYQRFTRWAIIRNTFGYSIVVSIDGQDAVLEGNEGNNVRVKVGGSAVGLYSCGWPETLTQPGFDAGCRTLQYTMFPRQQWEVVTSPPHPRIVMRPAP